ncbi:hypothetical protein QBC38DRAFT_444607 [Podospora fimiseda]|uniref:Uncharacterized protein n=1 Tax=Podospora fimiseda TaxID=252190 RepID=A0AAN7BN95_9PEZI|nr:hypothetical protein QBC38DRAFT_444607 [Podospora fimiseda]
MRATTLFSTLLAAAATVTASSSSDHDHDNDYGHNDDSSSSSNLVLAPIYIQPVTHNNINNLSPPTLLAEIQYPSSSSSTDDSSSRPEIISYSAPEFETDSSLVRVGVWDEKSKKWTSSTSVLAAKNFGKGYSPHFLLTLDNTQQQGNKNGDGEEQVIGVVVRGVKIDAGITRDFGPQVIITRVEMGKEVEMGRDVKVDEGGRRVEVQEKSFLQKYWWALAIAAVLLVGGGGDGK